MARKPPKQGQRWQPGEHESVSCKTKLRYASAIAAGKAKDAIKRRPSGPGNENLNVYRCQYCDGYHLGRPRRLRRKWKRQREDN